MTKYARIATMILACMNAGYLLAAGYPQAKISNGEIQAQLYLPDTNDGYYRGTRFDWSGVIGSLQYKNHDFYGPWFQRMDPTVHDYIYKDAEILAGPHSAISGPVQEFKPIGYDEAKAGETFLKIGVGVLRKPDDAPYDHNRKYEIVNSGKWTTQTGSNWVKFTQKLSGSDGYGYLYTKTIRLIKGRPEMVIEHSLKNTGNHPIVTNVYDHNFLSMDHHPPGAGLTITFPFTIENAKPLAQGLAEMRGNQISYLKDLQGKDTVATQIRGFSGDAKDYDIRIESQETGTGMRIQGNRPIARMGLWSIRSVVAVEPYLDISIDPAKAYTWDYTYTYYTIPQNEK